MSLLNFNMDAHMLGRRVNNAMKIIGFNEHPEECLIDIAHVIGQIKLHEPKLTDCNFRTESYLLAELEKGASREKWIAAAAKINQMNELTRFLLEWRHTDSNDYLYGRIEIRRDIRKMMRGSYLLRYGNVRGLIGLLNRPVKAAII